jgi:micrococcal nuclease
MTTRTPSAWAAILLGALIVVDGDTVELDGRSYRLLGFDTPETYHALCPAEYQAGIAAGQRLQEIINAGATLHPTGKSCKSCKYGRECAYMKLGEVDVPRS